MNLIEKALAIALKAHTGQVDKAGRAYILHPLRLMMKLEDESDQAAALLHDVIEDTDYTAEALKEEGIPDQIVAAVSALSKNAGEDYEAFVDRAGRNPIARKVKLADLEDNMNILRLETVNDKDLERLRKYHAAWKKLAEEGDSLQAGIRISRTAGLGPE